MKVEIDYTNHRGERSKRIVVPSGISFGKTQWHPEECWLLHAFDVGKGAERAFRMADVHAWRELP